MVHSLYFMLFLHYLFLLVYPHSAVFCTCLSFKKIWWIEKAVDELTQFELK